MIFLRERHLLLATFGCEIVDRDAARLVFTEAGLKCFIGQQPPKVLQNNEKVEEEAAAAAKEEETKKEGDK
jgi:hypothetical protein